MALHGKGEVGLKQLPPYTDYPSSWPSLGGTWPCSDRVNLARHQPQTLLRVAQLPYGCGSCLPGVLRVWGCGNTVSQNGTTLVDKVQTCPFNCRETTVLVLADLTS